MSFPAGPLPNAGQVADFQKTVRPMKQVAFAGGGADLDLTNPTNGLTPCATEFVCTVSGTFIAAMAGDVNAAGVATTQTYNLLAGDLLPGLWVLAKSTSGCSGVFRQ